MMATKKIKRLGKRGLAMFLTLVMMTSMMQLQVFAAGSADQIMDGWFNINENNEVGAELLGSGANEGEGFKVSKIIAPTAKENEFEITLTVETSQTVTTSDAAVQLVIDTSSSMTNCSEACGKSWCSHDDRLEAVQKILTKNNGFLDNLTKTNSGRVFVSVISFSADAITRCGWTDIKTARGLEAVKNAVNELGNVSGTNIHAGLMLARNRLGMSELATVSDSNKYTVLLSDGEASKYSNSSTSTDRINSAPLNGYPHEESRARSNAMAKELKQISELYAVGYGVGREYLNLSLDYTDRDTDKVFVGNDSTSINDAFANIATSATNGMNGAGTAVTDPMGSYIVLGNVDDLADEGVTASGGTITWELDPSKASVSKVENVTTYTYSVTYPITLDTAAKGFQENVYYPTNEYTYLSVPQADGSFKQVAFPIPGVKGMIPEYDWTVEYYLQDEAQAGDYDNYTKDDSDNMGKADLWSSVTAPEGYADKFAADDYSFAAGETTLQITEGENVMKLYYNAITAPVTVNYFYKTDAILADGTEVPGVYAETPDDTDIATVKVNTSYTAAEQPIFGGVSYELDGVDPAQTITVEKNGANVINLYYTRLVDERAITSAKVEHIYNSYNYKLVDGKFQLGQDATATETAEQADNIKATTTFSVSPAPLAGYEAYALNPDLGDYNDLLQANGTLSFVVAEDASDNIRTLVFEKFDDNRGEPILVTVNHIYTKSVTSVVDGQVVTTVEPNGEIGKTEFFDAYVGESFAAAESNEYLNDTYISDAGNAAKLSIDALTGSVTIDLYYTLTLIPEPIEITVNHIYRTFTTVITEETEEVLNEETGEMETVVIGTKEDIVSNTDSEDELIVNSLYEGQSYIAALAGKDGYSFNADDSDERSVNATDGLVIDLYYDRTAEDDQRQDAEIDVQHNYKTNLTTVIDGSVTIITRPDGTVNEAPVSGVAGDDFAAIPAPSYNGNDYTRTTADEALNTVLQPGTNSTIVIDYIRDDSDLVLANYTVNYEFRTYTMTVENGVAGYYDAPAVELAGGDPQSAYVGMKLSLNDGARDGFAPLATNPAVTQILAEDGQSWTFVYERYIPLAKGTVTVNNYYKTTTIAIDGTASESNSSKLGTPVVKYLGEEVLAQSEANGFELVNSMIDGLADAQARAEITVTVTGDTVIDFYFEKTIDNSILTNYSIAHIYNLYTWDGELISTSAPDAITGTGYATTRITASPEANGYTLVDATYNGGQLAEPYSVALIQGENNVIFTYEKTLVREQVDVKVIHNYFQDADSVTNGEPLSSATDTFPGIPEDSSFTAEELAKYGYEFYSADPADKTIVVTKDGENVIILNYVRQTAQYKVVQEYFSNNELDGTIQSESISGFVGDVIDGDTITRMNLFEGKAYEFKAISEDITLEAGVEQIITLTYERVIADPPSTPSDPIYYELIVRYEDENGNELTDPTEVSKRRGTKYETEQKEFEGYEFVKVTGDDISGRMTGDVEVIYIYRPIEEPGIDLQDDDVPLADLPEIDEPLEELPEEEIPLAEAPATGENEIYRILALASGIALAGLALTGKKREDEELA